MHDLVFTSFSSHLSYSLNLTPPGAGPSEWLVYEPLHHQPPLSKCHMECPPCPKYSSSDAFICSGPRKVCGYPAIPQPTPPDKYVVEYLPKPSADFVSKFNKVLSEKGSTTVDPPEGVQRPSVPSRPDPWARGADVSVSNQKGVMRMEAEEVKQFIRDLKKL